MSLNAQETIASKLKLEQESLSEGINIKSYSSDNGMCKSAQFMKELSRKVQGIRLSGVGAHHHNGCAEVAINLVVYKARSMVIHAALHWPDAHVKDLWPLALNYAAYLYNIIPKQDSGLSPDEIWSGVTSNHEKLRVAQTWGCPAYVLDPKLQNGQKIPKWSPRSRRGQFLGVSPLHASTVGLIKNLKTGRLSPQFHVVYDSNFETVNSNSEDPPDIWTELITFSSFGSDYDDEYYVPKLDREWLTD